VANLTRVPDHQGKERTINYPKTVDEILKDKTYKPETLRALRAFKKQKPWHGDESIRREKFAVLHKALCEVYGKQTRLSFEAGWAHYSQADDCIFLPKLSVVTYLHEFAHALYGHSERTACRWSVNLFRRVFPKQFAKCSRDGHLLRAQ
jgi:hypothetical protein